MFKKPVVHQFHSGSARGDAVTNALFLVRGMLRQLGFTSRIYVEHIAPGLEKEVLPHHKLQPGKNDITLVHHSLGHDREEWVTGLAGRKILVYHNITPAAFFPASSPMARYSLLGREQLKRFLPVMAAAVGDSRLNVEELTALGYPRVREIPLLLDTEALAGKAWDPAVVDTAAGIYTLLFVGRICPNKCQHDLIHMARHLKTMMTRPFQLVLAGGYDAQDPYYKELAAQVRTLGLTSCVRFTGKISDAALYGWYRAADLFVSMSEHEGFGVPLVEAMTFDVPVIAFKSSNVPHTLGGAGILITRKEHEKTAALVRIISRDRALERALVRAQRRQLPRFSRTGLIASLQEFFREMEIDVPRPAAPAPPPGTVPPAYQVEGPFETSYSLALLNRETALALDAAAPGRVGLFATEGPGDYVPDAAAVRALPGVEALWKRGGRGSRAGTVIRNLYPPRVADMDGQINLLYFAWEESGLPREWVTDFNRHLDGLPVLSEFICKTLVDNGVSLPARAVGCGVDHIFRPDSPPADAPSALARRVDFIFLHVSSCFPRKGVDVLLDAYARTFTARDGVGLVIKTFPNPHNTIEQQVADLKKRIPDAPPVEIISRELTPAQMAALYRQCHALAAPSRGEGFGLPMAEAMVHGLPVITTAWGGQADFCTPETAWLVDFSFQPAQSHMGLMDSVWMEPDVRDLGRCMKTVRFAARADLAPRLEAARSLITREFTWEACAARMRTLEEKISTRPPLARKKLRLGWISSWNTRCGIATYSRFLTDALPGDAADLFVYASESPDILEPEADAAAADTAAPDAPRVTRCWTDRNGEVTTLLAAMDQHHLDAVVVQFNFAFFTTRHLQEIIAFAAARDIVVVVAFHATKDVTVPGLEASLAPAAPVLAMARRLVVHTLDDLNRLKSWGLYRNTVLFPHGVTARPPLLQQLPEKWGLPEKKIILATYGFMLPHKGLVPFIHCGALLKQRGIAVHLLLVNAAYPGGASDETHRQCLAAVEQNGLSGDVTLVTDFLPDRESLSLLARARLIVFPYQETAESASGAVRYGLAAGRPVACTPLDIFADVEGVTHRLPGTSPQDMADGIAALLADAALLHNREAARRDYLAHHDWSVLGHRLSGMLTGLVRNRNRAGNKTPSGPPPSPRETTTCSDT